MQVPAGSSGHLLVKNSPMFAPKNGKLEEVTSVFSKAILIAYLLQE